MSAATSEDDRPQWRHRMGDRYAAVAANIVGNPEHGYRHSYWTDGDIHRTWLAAKRAGFAMDRSDDFNIAAIRGGSIAALLWMRTVVDDGDDVLADVAEQTGLPFNATGGDQ